MLMVMLSHLIIAVTMAVSPAAMSDTSDTRYEIASCKAMYSTDQLSPDDVALLPEYESYDEYLDDLANNRYQDEQGYGDDGAELKACLDAVGTDDWWN